MSRCVNKSAQHRTQHLILHHRSTLSSANRNSWQSHQTKSICKYARLYGGMTFRLGIKTVLCGDLCSNLRRALELNNLNSQAPMLMSQHKLLLCTDRWKSRFISVPLTGYRLLRSSVSSRPRPTPVFVKKDQILALAHFITFIVSLVEIDWFVFFPVHTARNIFC